MDLQYQFDLLGTLLGVACAAVAILATRRDMGDLGDLSWHDLQMVAEKALQENDELRKENEELRKLLPPGVRIVGTEENGE